MKKNIKLISITAVILLIAGFFIVQRLLKDDKVIAAPAAARGGGAVTVDAIVVNYVPFSDFIRVNGSLRPNESVELATEIAGRVTGIFFKEGGFVKKGELILKINDADLQAQLKRAEFRKNIAEDKERRLFKLLNSQGVSQEDYEVSLNELRVTEAEIELIKAQIDKTEIKAPFDGIAGLRYVSEGAYLNPNTKIAIFQSLNPLKVEFNIPQRYSATINSGSRVKVSLSGGGGVTEGVVYAVEPQIDVSSRTVKVRAYVNNPNAMFKPGAYVDVDLSVSNLKDALVVPSTSVVPDFQGHSVFVKKGNKAVPVKIEIGTRTENSVVVNSGLNAGDTVIVSGIIQLRPNIDVKIGSIL